MKGMGPLPLKVEGNLKTPNEVSKKPPQKGRAKEIRGNPKPIIKALPKIS